MAKPRITNTMPYDSPEGLVFLYQKSRRNSNDITPNWGAKYRWGRFELALFDQYLAVSQKRCKIGTYLLLKANRNSQALYRMGRFSVTLGDPKPHHFLHFAMPFIFPQRVKLGTSQLVGRFIVTCPSNFLCLQDMSSVSLWTTDRVKKALSRSRDILIFWQISVNISKTVQDLQWKTNRKWYMTYQMAATAVTLNDLEGHSLVAGLFKCNQ